MSSIRLSLVPSADGDVLVDLDGRLAPARIDDDNLATAMAGAFESTQEVRRGAQRSIGCIGVRAEQDDVVGVVEIGDGTVADPNISAEEISFGRWSTIDAENRFLVPSAKMRFRL